jgi:hypothetical protein
MNDKFGSWIWYCWKDKKPDDGEYIYVYWSDYPEYEVDIGKPEEFNVSLDENTYWCYVFMPDIPKISKIDNKCAFDKINELEDRINKLNIIISDMTESHDRLLNMINKLHDRLLNMINKLHKKSE